MSQFPQLLGPLILALPVLVLAWRGASQRRLYLVAGGLALALAAAAAGALALWSAAPRLVDAVFYITIGPELAVPSGAVIEPSLYRLWVPGAAFIVLGLMQGLPLPRERPGEGLVFVWSLCGLFWLGLIAFPPLPLWPDVGEDGRPFMSLDVLPGALFLVFFVSAALFTIWRPGKVPAWLEPLVRLNRRL